MIGGGLHKSQSFFYQCFADAALYGNNPKALVSLSASSC